MLYFKVNKLKEKVMDTSDFKESYRILNKIKEFIKDGELHEANALIDSERQYIKEQLEKEGITVED